jgi:DNA-binding transcriptional LysR family regulator
LEEWLGVELFVRTSQGATLTTAGRELINSAQDLTRQLYQLRSRARDIAGKEQRLLRFAATYSLSFTFFPRWVRSLDSQASFETMRLTTDSMKTCEQMLINGEANFLLCHSHPDVPTFLPEKHFVFKTIGSECLIPVVGSAAYIEKEEAGKVSLPFLKFSGESALGRILDLQLPKIADGLSLEVVFESHLSPVLLSMVMESKGIAWLPQSIIESDMRSGSVRRAFDESFDVPLDIRLYRPNGDMGVYVERFWESIRE